MGTQTQPTQTECSTTGATTTTCEAELVEIIRAKKHWVLFSNLVVQRLLVAPASDMLPTARVGCTTLTRRSTNQSHPARLLMTSSMFCLIHQFVSHHSNATNSCWDMSKPFFWS